MNGRMNMAHFKGQIAFSICAYFGLLYLILSKYI